MVSIGGLLGVYICVVVVRIAIRAFTLHDQQHRSPAFWIGGALLFLVGGLLIHKTYMTWHDKDVD
jgi:hypothetical protein